MSTDDNEYDDPSMTEHGTPHPLAAGLSEGAAYNVRHHADDSQTAESQSSLRRNLECHSSAPPATIVIKEFKPRTGPEIPGSDEWMKAHENSTTAP